MARTPLAARAAAMRSPPWGAVRVVSMPEGIAPRRRPGAGLALVSGVRAGAAAGGGSSHLDARQLGAVRVDHMHRAGNARVETVDGALDLERLLRVVQMVAVHERRFVGAGLLRRVARAGVPGAGHDGLVVVDQPVLDD